MKLRVCRNMYTLMIIDILCYDMICIVYIDIYVVHHSYIEQTRADRHRQLLR